MSAIRRHVGLGTFGLSLLLTGCATSGDAPTAIDLPMKELASIVTSDVARNLTAAGEFVLPAAVKPASAPIISSERAADLAVSYLRTWGQFLETSWEFQRGGGDIDLTTLQPASRVFFAATPYQLLENVVHPANRKSFGPYYLVTFTSSGEPVLSIAVSAYNTDLGIDEKGMIVLPKYSGNDFIPLGLHAGRPWPMSPERAANIAAAATGARVASTPRLVLASKEWVPQAALWRITLDQPVAVRGKETRVRYATNEVFVGPHGTLKVPRGPQPSEVAARVVTRLPTREVPHDHGTRSIGMVPGMPVVFEEIAPESAR